MKKLLLLASATFVLAGCISPNWNRLVPENKDADIEVNTLYGHIIIHSRVNPNGTNPLAPLPPPPGQNPVVLRVMPQSAPGKSPLTPIP